MEIGEVQFFAKGLCGRFRQIGSFRSGVTSGILLATCVPHHLIGNFVGFPTVYDACVWHAWEARSMLGDGESTLGDAESTLGDGESTAARGWRYLDDIRVESHTVELVLTRRT